MKAKFLLLYYIKKHVFRKDLAFKMQQDFVKVLNEMEDSLNGNVKFRFYL